MNGKILNKEALKAWILSKMVTLTNNLLATTPGISAMDAAQGPVIQGQIDAINSNFGGLSFYEDETGNKYVVGADSVPKKLGEVELKSFPYTAVDSWKNIPLPVSDAKVVMVRTNYNNSGAFIDMVKKSVIFYSPNNVEVRYIDKSTIAAYMHHGSSIDVYYM